MTEKKTKPKKEPKPKKPTVKALKGCPEKLKHCDDCKFFDRDPNGMGIYCHNIKWGA